MLRHSGSMRRTHRSPITPCFGRHTGRPRAASPPPRETCLEHEHNNWRNGVLECWSAAAIPSFFFVFHHSTTPPLHHSLFLAMPSIPIIMPQLGESIAEATIVNLLVQVGDRVQADQDIIEVET